MKALMKKKPAPGAEWTQTDIPKLGARDVLVKIKATSICGTDLHIYHWDDWAKSRVKTPRIFGHEFCGDIVEVGELVSKVNVGDYVSGETHLADYNCFQCRIANAHICEHLKILGIDRNGSYAEYISLPENSCIQNDRRLPPKLATVQEPLGNAVHAVFAQPIAGNQVSIFGCGPIGLCAIQLCKVAGATNIFAVDQNEYRLKMAKSFGADYVINATTENAAKRILKETKRGVDVFLEMSGNEKALQQGFKSMRPGGNAAILGVFGKSVSLDVTNAVVFKQATVRGITGRRLFETWHKVKAFLRSGKVDLNQLVTHEFKLEEYGKAFALMTSGNCGKIVLYPK